MSLRFARFMPISVVPLILFICWFIVPVQIRWLYLLALFITIAIVAMTLGAPVPLSDLWSSDAARVEIARAIFFELRPVRLLAAILVGAALATSGAALQAVFRNPLAEPYLLGVSAGGALGATCALALQVPDVAGFAPVSVCAFVGALSVSMIVYRLGQTDPGDFGSTIGNRSDLLLIGVAVSALLSALMSLVVALSARADLAQQTMFWLLGGLSEATGKQNQVLFGALVIGFTILAWTARDLNALQLGDEEAAGLGVEVAAVHRRLLLAAALMSAAAVAMAGLIGFVGLLAPHLIRLTFGRDARVLLPASAIGGATLLMACDAIARSIVSPIELPIGVVTALLGVPLFLYLMRRA